MARRPWFLPDPPDTEEEWLEGEIERWDADLGLVEHRRCVPCPGLFARLLRLGRVLLALVLLAAVAWIALEVGGFLGEGRSLRFW